MAKVRPLPSISVAPALGRPKRRREATTWAGSCWMMVLQHLRGWWGTWTGRNTSAWRPRWPWQNPREPAGPKPKRRRRQGLWKRKMKLMKEGLWELLGVVLHQCQKGHISWPPRPPEVGDPLVRTGRAPRKCPSRRAPDGLQGLSKTRPTPVTERKTQQWGAWSMRGACVEHAEKCKAC